MRKLLSSIIATAFLISAAPAAAGAGELQTQPSAQTSLSTNLTHASTASESTLDEKRGSRPPNYVASYRDHALQRMAQRNVSRDEVEAVVANPKGYHWSNIHNSWQLSDRNGRILVSINDNAEVVTVVVIKRA